MQHRLNSTRDRHEARAFTLIEVLVVVAIIALLVSILIPSLTRAREQAKKTLCASNMHQVTVALLSYAQSHKGRLPHFENAPDAQEIVNDPEDNRYFHLDRTRSPNL